jgi:hypothetical protein
MRMDRIEAQHLATECSAAMRLPDQTPSPEWEQAVSSAAKCLHEGWILPDTKCHPAVEAELAALMSAYGMLPNEIDVPSLLRLAGA